MYQATSMRRGAHKYFSADEQRNPDEEYHLLVALLGGPALQLDQVAVRRRLHLHTAAARDL